MASHLSQPRTVFHRRLQANNDTLERGFSDLRSSLKELTKAVMCGPLNKILTAKIRDHPELVDTNCSWKWRDIASKDPMAHAISQMCQHKITILFVEDGGKIIGIITRDQILKAINENKIDLPVAKFTQRIISIKDGDTIEAALDKFERHGVKRLIVVDAHNKRIAILTSGMLLRWLAKKLKALQPCGSP